MMLNIRAGQDFKTVVRYEFGLRSDGIVVWREVKP